MLSEGRVGPAVASDGSTQPIRQGKTTEVIVTDAHGRYEETTYRGNTFTTCTTASVAFGPTAQALLFASTTPGFTLYNPVGSGRCLAMIDATLVVSGSPSLPTTLAWAANNNPQLAAPTSANTLTPINTLLGAGPKSIASVFYGGGITLAAAPTPIRIIASVSSGTVGSLMAGFIGQPVKDEIAGAIILQPGTSISINSSAAVNALVSCTWEEIPI